MIFSEENSKLFSLKNLKIRMEFAPENLTVLRKNTCLKHFFSDFFRTKPKIIGAVCCADLTFAGSFWQLILFWFALLKRVKWSFSRYLPLTRMFLVTWEFIFAKLILPRNKTKNTCFFGSFGALGKLHFFIRKSNFEFYSINHSNEIVAQWDIWASRHFRNETFAQ